MTRKRKVKPDLSGLAPSGWYEQDEIVVSSWIGLQEAIAKVLNRNTDRQWVWRGQSNSKYALTSALYRELAKDAFARNTFPTEHELQAREMELIQIAHATYRLTPQNPLSLLATLQHLKVATRFIDVTKNAYVAAWFATATSLSDATSDGRIFAFGYAEDSSLSNNSYAATQIAPPFWFGDEVEEWGSGKLNFWFPPVDTHERIFSQNAGFVFDGIPNLPSGSSSNYRKRVVGSKTTGYWSKEEILQATSIDVNFVNGKIKARNDSKKTPVYTIKIANKAKEKIRIQLEREMALIEAHLFPGIEGMAAAKISGK